jgi:hypothetical protein
MRLPLARTSTPRFQQLEYVKDIERPLMLQVSRRTAAEAIVVHCRAGAEISEFFSFDSVLAPWQTCWRTR